jgi:ATP-binding cassette, subfamily C, type I secretion system permease/ATPase
VAQLPRIPSQNPQLAAALKDWRASFWTVAIFSGVVNVLMLAGPLYMLQVYDRVLSSRSVPTLVALTIALIGAYAFQGALDLIRARVVARAAELLDWRLGTVIHDAVVRIGVQSRRPGDAHQPVRDLDQVRMFLTGSGPIAIVDLPWIPIFLFICFLIHPWLGALSLAGAILLTAVTLLTERASREPTRLVSSEAGARSAMVEATRRNSETVVAMGMADALAGRWTTFNRRYLDAAGRASDVVTSYGSITKVLRLFMQSAILGLGAYLVIRQELTAGAMIAASIMMGRALSPIEVAIANWRSFVSARDSLRRLSQVLSRLNSDRVTTPLPRPTRVLDVENVIVAAPGATAPIVGNVKFQVSSGDALGIVGPSGSGKTSLVRTLVGIWPPAKGAIRLDGAALDQWTSTQLGPHVGYVSQAMDLFDGTISENIARMSPQPDADMVLAAAQAAGVHDMILRLPSGYDTKIGESGTVLSAGQQQRVALARALYGSPFLVVLDEPNSNLDNDGEAALQQAIVNLRARGAIVLLIAHRPSALAACNKVLFLANGTQQAFGPRDEVLRKILPRAVPPAAAAPQANLKVVGEATGGGDR